MLQISNGHVNPKIGFQISEDVSAAVNRAFRRNDLAFFKMMQRLLTAKPEKIASIMNLLGISEIARVKETPYLKLINTVTISACEENQKSLADFEVMFRWIDNYFDKDHLRQLQPATEETLVEVWELTKRAPDFTYKKVIQSFDTKLNNLAWENQAQIIKFCTEHKDLLQIGEESGTRFPIFEKDRLIYAVVFVKENGLLELDLHTDNYELSLKEGKNSPRFVVPANWSLVM